VVFGAVFFKLLVWCGAEGYVSGLQDAANTHARARACVCVSLSAIRCTVSRLHLQGYGYEFRTRRENSIK